MFWVALEDYLVVADEHGHGPRARISMLPQEDVYFTKYFNRRGAKGVKRVL
jgi:hypothetical protein